MRSVWLAVLLVFCTVAAGFILKQGERAPGPARELAALPAGGGVVGEEGTAPEPDLAGPHVSDADHPPATFYRYTDETGTVRFVTSLEQVPWKLRASAQPVAHDRVQRAPAARLVSRPPRGGAGDLARSSHQVVVYTTSWCGWCRKTLAFLNQQGVEFENRDIEEDESYREELLEKTGGTSIPVVEIDGQIIRGYDPQRMAQLLRDS